MFFLVRDNMLKFLRRNNEVSNTFYLIRRNKCVNITKR